MDMHDSLDRFSCGPHKKLLQGPLGDGRARVPNLSPALYSAHDHAEGEFFSDANENAGRAREAAQAGQNGQEIAGRGGGLEAGCEAENPGRAGENLGSASENR
jgi:hypothetical protein